MKTRKKENTDKRIWVMVFAILAVVELGWWTGEKLFCEREELKLDSTEDAKKAEGSFFCRLVQD